MSDQTILCPKCGEQIPLTDALTGKIRDQLKGEIEKGVLEKEKQLDDMRKQEPEWRFEKFPMPLDETLAKVKGNGGSFFIAEPNRGLDFMYGCRIT